MTDKLCRHYYITGKVQGVWFRDSTKNEALRLGVTGWVRNLGDGRVEAMVCGSKDQLEALHSWLQQGPELANVTDASFEEKPCEDFDGFQIR